MSNKVYGFFDAVEYWEKFFNGYDYYNSQNGYKNFDNFKKL